MIDDALCDDVWERCVPGMQEGVLRVRTSGDPEDTFTNYNLELVKIKRLTKEDFQTLIGYPSNLAYLAKQYRICQVWRVHLQAAGAPDPKTNDVFVVDGKTYVVKTIVKQLLETVHNSLVEVE